MSLLWSKAFHCSSVLNGEFLILKPFPDSGLYPASLRLAEENDKYWAECVVTVNGLVMKRAIWTRPPTENKGKDFNLISALVQKRKTLSCETFPLKAVAAATWRPDRCNFCCTPTFYYRLIFLRCRTSTVAVAAVVLLDKSNVSLSHAWTGSHTADKRVENLGLSNRPDKFWADESKPSNASRSGSANRNVFRLSSGDVAWQNPPKGFWVEQVFGFTKYIASHLEPDSCSHLCFAKKKKKCENILPQAIKYSTRWCWVTVFSSSCPNSYVLFYYINVNHDVFRKIRHSDWPK